ncbi:MAG TPA: DUF3592 domain-containing protein [Phycisphaerales bacterium]|nr:DUF3592 domain-containing protein [Phycisphaerales bacterium]
MEAFLSEWTEPDRLFPLFGAIFFLGGLGICAWGRWMVARSRAWLSTSGHVVSGAVESRRNGGCGSDAAGARVFVARIVYAYQVAGRWHRASRIVVGGELNTSSRSRAERRLELYAPGSEVEVFYDPHNPANACLERRTEVTGFALLIAAVGAGVVLYHLL